MNIQDILRGLPFPMQGALMSLMGGQQNPNYYTPSDAVNQIPTGGPQQAPRAPQQARPRQVPKDEAGFESLIGRVMGEDQASSPQVAALPVTEVPSLPPVAAAMAQESGAPSAESMAPDNRDKGGGQNIAMQGPAAPEERGFFDKLVNNTDAYGNSALMHIFRGLGAAGSQDPMKQMAQYAQQDTERGKIAEARRARMMPKREQINGTPIAQIIGPNGELIREETSPVLAAFIKSQSENKAAQKLLDMQTQAKLNAEAAGGKAADKLATETLPEVTQARSNIGELRGIASEIGTLNKDGTFTKTTDNVSGPIAGTAAALPIIGPTLNPAGADIRNRAERVIQGGLRAVLGGQYTQNEGDRFIARAYDKNADEATNFRSLQRSADELETMVANKEAAVKWFQERKTMAGFTEALAEGKVGAGATGGVARPASKADYDALKPGTKYIAPNGMELTKK